MNKKIDIAGVGFDAVRYEDVLTASEVFMNSGHKKHLVVTPNPEMIVEAWKNEEFRRVLNSASLSMPDGIGVLWAAYYLSLPLAKSGILETFRLIGTLFQVLFRAKSIYRILPARVTGTDLLPKMVRQSQENGWRIYLLGAAPGVAGIAIDRLIQKYPKAVFAGSFAGTPAPTHEDELCERINSAKPDILFVAYGSPAQEEWIYRNLKKLDTVKMAIGVGGAIDFAAGRSKRAPKFIQNLGLEWLYRLIRQPGRIKRIWNATFVFVRLVFKLKRN